MRLLPNAADEPPPAMSADSQGDSDPGILSGVECWDDIRHLRDSDRKRTRIDQSHVATHDSRQHAADQEDERDTFDETDVETDQPPLEDLKGTKVEHVEQPDTSPIPGQPLPEVIDTHQQSSAGLRLQASTVPALALDDSDATQGKRRSRRAAVVGSVTFHGLLIVLLGFLTLSVRKPGDQVQIAGSVAETDEIAIESIEIEPSEPKTEEVESSSPTEFDVSDIGDLAVTEVSLDGIGEQALPTIDKMLGSSSARASATSLKSNSDSKSQFCGIEGGGNHFVYLVDSSGSMGDAFESARAELLRSIDALRPKQRFYVIFFDAEPDYMRIASPNRDERASVFATPQNKRALGQWAMSIEMDRGKGPYEALPFALRLKPDVIFLLSDGEFTQRIEDILTQQNRVNNLFGDEGPISIVHTIGYHSRDGESRMRRIAKQNGGKYRHVPKP